MSSSTLVETARRPPVLDFAVIGHLESWEKTAAVVRILRGPERGALSLRDVQEIVPFLPPRTVCRVTVFSRTGASARGVYVDAFLAPDRLDAASLHENVRRVQDAAECARREGARVAALGGFSSIVLEGNMELLAAQGEVSFTTGNTLTVAYIVKGVEEACRLARRSLAAQTVLILGATGDVGSGCARYLLPRVGRLRLCARNPSRLRKLARSFGSHRACVRMTTDADEFLTEADFVVAAASLWDRRFSLRLARKEAIVCDAGYPRNVQPEAGDGPVVFFGGMGQAQGGFRLEPDLLSVLAPHPAPNVVQGCLLEAMVLALEHRYESFSRGRGKILPESVDEIWSLAQKHGFTLAPFFNDEGLCADRIAALAGQGAA